jgi:hypothetical protein
MKEHKLVVLASPLPGKEAEFDRWYDIHAQELVRLAPPLHSSQRFRAVTPSVGEQPPHPHLVIAEWRADDLAASWAKQQEAWATGVFTPVPEDAFNLATVQHWFYEPISPRYEKE